MQNCTTCGVQKKKSKKSPKVWLVTVDMGYGHQRASFPLKKLAYGEVINANSYKGIPKADREIWSQQRKFYEAVSRFKKVPVLGNVVFNLMDKMQEVPNFYPRRDLSKPSLQLKSLVHLTKNKEWGKHLIEKLSKNPLPIVTTFFTPAIMAETHGYPGEIYLVVCDADVSRAWAPKDPKKSKVKYFAPNKRIVERLQLYGVPKSRIFFTGFPLPDENLGCPSFKIVRDDIKHRLLNLDPNRDYIDKYKETLKNRLKIKNFPKKSNHPLTLTFAVGGAGAQRELGGKIIKQLKERIEKKEIKINLIAGVHHSVNKYFKTVIEKNGLKKELGRGVDILFVRNKQEYMKEFNQLLRKTDILWTKPSELSFYCALGIPIIIAPPIGSQEFFNQEWLIYLGGGIDQGNPKYLDQWLFDWIESGRLAEAAAQGFLEAPKLGTYNIEKILSK